MINITLNASTNKELTAMLDTLTKAGLINKLSIIEPVEVNAPVKTVTQQPAQTNPVQTNPVQINQVNAAPMQPTINGYTAPAQVNQVNPAPMQPVNVAPVQVNPVPTTAPSYTTEQLALAATRGLMDTGRQPELHQILASFGVQSLMQLPKEQYGAFATALRAKGCQI